MPSRHALLRLAVSAVLGAGIAVAAALPTVAASAAPTRHPNTDPLAGQHWGVPSGPSDALWRAYHSSRGTTHTMLGRSRCIPARPGSPASPPPTTSLRTSGP